SCLTHPHGQIDLWPLVASNLIYMTTLDFQIKNSQEPLVSLFRLEMWHFGQNDHINNHKSKFFLAWVAVSRPQPYYIIIYTPIDQIYSYIQPKTDLTEFFSPI